MILSLLLACDPWDLGEPSTNLNHDALWDPNVVAATDGVYARLTESNRLVRVTGDGAWNEVDLDGAAADSLVVAPDGSGLLVTTSWDLCEDEDPAIVYVDECPNERLVTERETVLVRDGAVVGVLEGVAPQLNAAAWAPDNSVAALYLDVAAAGGSVEVDGFVNLNEVSFVNMSTAEVNRVPVGFAAEAILFSDAGDRAVVLSRSQVAVVNLGEAEDDCGSWEVCVTYPLTLDADQVVVPTNVVLVANGAYAMVSVTGSRDVYVLDLEAESIDLLELSGVPSAMVDDPENDRTVIVYTGSARADVVDHTFFELQSITLDEPASRAELTPSGVLLYNDVQSYKDVVTFDPATGDWDEQRAENPISELKLTDRFAVATMRPESSSAGGAGALYDQHYGLGIFTLAAPGTEGVGDPRALVLEAEPVGFATLSTSQADYALVLMADVDTLLKVRLDDAQAEGIDLDGSPLGVVATPDGNFVAPLDSSIGMLAFIDPVAGSVTTVAGFATVGLAERPKLPRRAAED